MILLVTEEPNSQSKELSRDEFFDHKRNGMAQFFGRTVFGDEERYRRLFNPNNVKWMHAREWQNRRGAPRDGRAAIIDFVSSADTEICLILAFGLPAAKLFLRNSSLNEVVNDNKYSRIQPLCKLKCKGDLKAVSVPIAFFPHVSGRSQSYWMNHAERHSKLILEVQKKIDILIR
jgi:hypothetical protein